MKKIVFLTDQYLPDPSAVGNCVAGLVKTMLQTGGVKVHVFAVASSASELADEEIDGQRITRYKSREMVRTDKLGMGTLPAKVYQFSSKVRRYLSAFLCKANFDRDLYDFYLRKLQASTVEPDLLVSTCFPPAAMLAGAAYASEHPQVRFVPYLFDPFADNRSYHRTGWNTNRLLAHHQALEERVLAQAYKVFLVRHLEDYYRQNHPDYQKKFIVTEQPTLVLQDATPDGPTVEGPIQLTYTGSLNKRMRPPAPILESLRTIDEKTPLRVHFFTMGNAVYEVDRFAERHPELIVNHGQVGKKEADEALAQADVLLSIGNLLANLSPSKIFEYIGYGKPILHFAYRSTDDVMRLLEDYPWAYSVDVSRSGKHGMSSDQAESIADWLQAACGKTVSQEQILKAYGDALPTEIAGLLLKCLRGGL